MGTFEQVKSSVIVNLARKAGPSLTRLTFSPEVVLSNTAVALVSSLTSLTYLELPGDWIKTAAAAAISSLQQLETLKLPGRSR